MIQANELRIGNHTQEGKINSFYEHGVHFGYGKCKKFSEINPIPLTEDILLKCGFEKLGNKYIIDGLILIITPSLKFVFNTREIRYLHQLQNLYFALTGKEL